MLLHFYNRISTGVMFIRKPYQFQTPSKWPREPSRPQFSRGHFTLSNVFFFLARRIKLEKRAARRLTSPMLMLFYSNTLRVTRAAALQGQDGGSTTTAGYVGKKGKDFEFGHVLPVKVEFAECSAKGQADGEAEVSAVEKWLEKIA